MNERMNFLQSTNVYWITLNLFGETIFLNVDEYFHVNYERIAEICKIPWRWEKKKDAFETSQVERVEKTNFDKIHLSRKKLVVQNEL
jgi:uncharacterized protein YkuJ